jgi:hypothetical protein
MRVVVGSTDRGRAAAEKDAMSDGLKAAGVARDTDARQSLSVAFNRVPTNDEMRAVHDFLRRPPASCPFCMKPTYRCPCTHCGEPDTLDGY